MVEPVRLRRAKGAATDMFEPKATASHLDSTNRVMTDTRTISQLEAEGYPWIGCECCKRTVWVSFNMIREKIPALSSWSLDELGAKMKCDRCGKRPERYYPAKQSDAPGFAKGS